MQVASAEQAAKKVDQELQSLQATLKDIESARPFEDLTTTDVARARPQITKAVEEMVKNGKWTTPGYGEKVCCRSGPMTMSYLIAYLPFLQHSSATSKLFRLDNRHRSALLSLSTTKHNCKQAQVYSFRLARGWIYPPTRHDKLTGDAEASVSDYTLRTGKENQYLYDSECITGQL